METKQAIESLKRLRWEFNKNDSDFVLWIKSWIDIALYFLITNSYGNSQATIRGGRERPS